MIRASARDGPPTAPARPTAPTVKPRMSPAMAFLVTTLATTYAMALAFFRLSIREASDHPWFAGTYLGCVYVSMALSLIALAVKPGLAVALIALVRCYAIVILGYGIPAYLSTKLALGIGLMTEICVLIAFPANLVVSAATILALSLAQAFPYFLGRSLVIDAVARPSAEELVMLTAVMALTAITAAWIVRLASRNAELADSLRIQELNVDTLAELNQNLQGYARTVDEESAERERNRISREIHDISGYIFTNLIALMDAAGSLPGEERSAVSDIIVTARKQAQEGLQETRTALRKLRSDGPRLADNAHAINKIVSIFRSVAGIRVDLNLGNLPRLLPVELNLALYRTIQEGLTNAVRHGMATAVGIRFWVREGRIFLTISDNGKGASEFVKGIGLSGMEERIGALGGRIDVGASLEGGFALAVDIPLPAAREPSGKVIK